MLKKSANRRIGRPYKPGEGGRPKGALNKLTRTAKENIQKVFDELGGYEGMVKWAKKSERNMTTFYSDIYPKLLPLDVQHSGEIKGQVVFMMPRPEKEKPGAAEKT